MLPVVRTALSPAVNCENKSYDIVASLVTVVRRYLHTYLSHILATGIIRGWCLILLRAPACAATIRGQRLFKEICYVYLRLQ